LSGGQRQRVGICRALIQNPGLLLVDEPTASLDPKTSRQIMRLIKELCAERKLSAIINIHDVMLAQMFAERIVGLQLGEIVYDGPPTGLTAEVLTKIYGEEDWSATIRKIDDDTDEADERPDNVIALDTRLPHRDRMAGQLMASALRRCRNHFDVVAVATNSDEAIGGLTIYKPHVALVSPDLEDGAQTGFKVLQTLRATHPETAGLVEKIGHLRCEAPKSRACPDDNRIVVGEIFNLRNRGLLI